MVAISFIGILAVFSSSREKISVMVHSEPRFTAVANVKLWVSLVVVFIFFPVLSSFPWYLLYQGRSGIWGILAILFSCRYLI